MDRAKIQCEILFPKEFDWYYEPPTDHTKTVVKQNADIVSSSSAFSPKNLPSKHYKSLLEGLIS